MMKVQLVCVTESGNWTHLTVSGERTLCGRVVAEVVPDARGVSRHQCRKRLMRETVTRINAADTNTYTLVAIADDADNLDVGTLIKAFRGAIVRHSVTPTTIGRNSLPATEYRFTLDPTMLRNTDAHSLACNRGFLANCE